MVRFDDEYGPHYNFPGGGHEPGETLTETVVRETEEETAALVDVAGCWSSPSIRRSKWTGGSAPITSWASFTRPP